MCGLQAVTGTDVLNIVYQLNHFMVVLFGFVLAIF